jgi:hypothetical protein
MEEQLRPVSDEPEPELQPEQSQPPPPPPPQPQPPPQPPPPPSLDGLDHAVLVYLLAEFVLADDALATAVVAPVCRSLRAATHDEGLWRRLLQRSFWNATRVRWAEAEAAALPWEPKNFSRRPIRRDDDVVGEMTARQRFVRYLAPDRRREGAGAAPMDGLSAAEDVVGRAQALDALGQMPDETIDLMRRMAEENFAAFQTFLGQALDSQIEQRAARAATTAAAGGAEAAGPPADPAARGTTEVDAGGAGARAPQAPAPLQHEAAPPSTAKSSDSSPSPPRRKTVCSLCNDTLRRSSGKRCPCVAARGARLPLELFSLDCLRSGDTSLESLNPNFDDMRDTLDELFELTVRRREI